MKEREHLFKYFEKYKEYMDERVKSGIEQYRKGFAEFKVVDKDNNPIEAKIEIKQKNHEFRYGANIFMLDEFETEEKNKIYREKFAEAFNIATVPIYWSDLEPEEGAVRFRKDSPRVYRRPPVDLCLEYCEENGIEPKCHCLNYENFLPEWLKNPTVEEHKQKLEKRFFELAEEYKDRIPSWEVTNETFLRNKWKEGSKFYHEDDYVEWSFKAADRYFPSNKLIINDWEIFGDMFLGNRSAYYMQIEKLINNKIHLDSIGMQFHCFYTYDNEAECAKFKYNPMHLYSLFDKYAELGKKIQITEMTIGALSDSEYDEEIQAELIEKLYSIFFSHPAMEAIVYWNVPDGYAAFAPQGDMSCGENQYYGGLLRFDLSEKPAYKRIKKLFSEVWHTEESKMTSNGEATFKAFYGDYDVVITTDDKVVEKTVKISSQKNNEFTFEV